MPPPLLSDLSDPPQTLRHIQQPTDWERQRIRLLAGNRAGLYRDIDLDAPAPIPIGHSLFDIYQEDLWKVGDHEWKERAIAAWAMGVCVLPDSKRSDAVAGLLTVLRDQREQTSNTRVRRFKHAALWTFIGVAGGGTALLFCIILLAASDCNGSLNPDIVLASLLVSVFMSIIAALVLAFPLAPAVLPFTMAADKHANQEARALAARSLLRLNVLEALPDLLEYAVDRSDTVRHECQNALRFLLPQVTEQNRDLLPANAETLLGKILSTSYDLTLAEIILDHLEQWGRGAAYDGVDNFLDRLRHFFFGIVSVKEEDVERMTAKAQRVHDLLEQRLAEKSARKELLRHSSSPQSAPEQLLRAAVSHAETQPETLLRPAASEPEAKKETP